MQTWTRIMNDVAADPWVAASVIFDLLNEPDSGGLTWGPTAGKLGGQGLSSWYHQVLSAGYGINNGTQPSQPLGS